MENYILLFYLKDRGDCCNFLVLLYGTGMKFLYDNLCKILSPEQVTIAADVINQHSVDRWYATATPDVVVLSRSTADVAAVMQYAYENDVPVYTRGAGVGYVGGCVPVRGGIALSVAQMNQILAMP